jgi:thioredoxin-like negative regulator of GroEL
VRSALSPTVRCRPCKDIAPVFARLANDYSDGAVLIKVDVDKCRDVAKAEQISAMPTFKFYKHGTLYHQFRGASAQQLEDGIKAYSQADAEPNPDADNSGGSSSCVLL